MPTNLDNNKRIAKNTMLLYVRMLITIFIGLYTSRVVLSTLGISDYGLYNVVGGVVAMFAFINGSLASGTMRFLTVEIGRGNIEKLKQVFSTSIVVHILISLVILFIAETIGLWFILHKMNFEPGRLEAAIWVYQFSIVASMISVIQVPFMSSLIAHEKMNIYAYMGIYDSVMKLLVVFLLNWFSTDKLILYGFLIMVVNLSSAIIYNIYCHLNYSECRFSFSFDKAIFKEMFSFSAWDTIGSAASIGQTHGVNVIINMFCGTVVKAARGISVTVNNIIMSFVGNFLMAANPQIIKHYARQEMEQMFQLVINASKLASYLLLIVSIPVFIEIEFLLSVWLGEYPEYSPLFIRIILIQSWIQTLGMPAIRALHAIGKIKLMNLIIGVLALSILPMTYILFRLDYDIDVILLANILPWIIALPVRLFLLDRYCGFPVYRFVFEVVIKGVIIAGVCFIIPYVVHYYTLFEGVFRFLTVGTVSVLSSSVIIYLFGIPKSIRLMINNKVRSIYCIFLKKYNV